SQASPRTPDRSQFTAEAAREPVDHFPLGDPLVLQARSIHRPASRNIMPEHIAIGDPAQIHAHKDSELVLIPMSRVDLDEGKPISGSVVLEFDLGESGIVESFKQLDRYIHDETNFGRLDDRSGTHERRILLQLPARKVAEQVPTSPDVAAAHDDVAVTTRNVFLQQHFLREL